MKLLTSRTTTGKRAVLRDAMAIVVRAEVVRADAAVMAEEEATVAGPGDKFVFQSQVSAQQKGANLGHPLAKISSC